MKEVPRGVEKELKLTRMVIPEDAASDNIYSERISAMLFAPTEEGQGLVEYAIILALVSIVVIAVMRLLGPQVGNTFSSISRSMDTF